VESVGLQDGLPVSHWDGMTGHLIGRDRWRDGYFIVQFRDGVRASHSATHLFVSGTSIADLMTSLSAFDHTWSIDRLAQELEAQADKIQREEEDRWFRERERLERKDKVLAELEQVLKSDFLSVDTYFRSLSQSDVSLEDLSELKARFVRDWVEEKNQRAIRGSSPFPEMDDEQLRAISALDANVQVVARAGSGKTTTMVTRAHFLIDHCQVEPSAILMLAFNRKAAQEIRRKLLARLGENSENQIEAEIGARISASGSRGRETPSDLVAQAVDAVAKAQGIALPHAMTFHALASAIVHPEQAILFDGAEPDSSGLGTVFQQVVDDHLRVPSFQRAIRKLMLEHFRDDWDDIERGGYHLGFEDLISFRRSLPRSSLAGDSVKSYGEKLIADFLIEHDVPYRYERSHRWGGINYRPDFTLFKSAGAQPTGVIIEYFGLKGDVDYDEMSEQKRAYWSGKPGWDLLELGPADISSRGKEAFLAHLKQCLEALGFTCNKLSEDELWNRVKDRALDNFTRAMVSFAGRCRKLSLEPSDLLARIDAHHPLTTSEAEFARLAHAFYAAYLGRLAATGEDDFDGLLGKSAEFVLRGQTRFERRQTGAGDIKKLRFVCIDEFQDFSDLFYKLLIAIRKQNPSVHLFCVGDDWQAINGFAGSNLRFFVEFERFIGESSTLPITVNYRSASAVVEVGNALMLGQGVPAKARMQAPEGDVVLADLARFSPTLIESQLHMGDDITPLILRISAKSIQDGHKVVVLSRTNWLIWYANYDRLGDGASGRGLERYLALLRTFLPSEHREMLSVSTVHKFKGLERHTVIVVDAVARCYPLVHPSWVFSRVLGASIENIVDEERRLFYVALSRAAERLFVITRTGEESTFLQDLEAVSPLTKIDLDEFPPSVGVSTRLVVRVSNQSGRKVKNADGGADAPTYALKDILKASGYRYTSAGGACWEKTFPTEGFSVEMIMSELWSQNADGICVQLRDSSERTLERYFVDNGVWERAET
jgi:DNA helicase IV